MQFAYECTVDPPLTATSLAMSTSSAPKVAVVERFNCIQLFRERLSEKVHATIPKGIVGGIVSPVLQRNLKEWHERPRTYAREC